MRRPRLPAVKHTFAWDDGGPPDRWRMPDTGYGWEGFCEVYGLLGRDRAPDLMVPLVWAYNEGRYEDALGYLALTIEEEPDAERHLGIYIAHCGRVLGVEFDEVDLEWRRSQGSVARRLLHRLSEPREFQIRCKWCGHFTRYIAPNSLVANSCGRCGAEYAAPDFGWDSMAGMAYCFGRGSWGRDSLAEQLWNEYFDGFDQRFQPTGDP